mmetsp:Transcript_17773/g.57576  ORF Transcript_17773/g.57576 Transcript_17773/m.57576 type:complete len:228 (-) Transcript_17773:527-1210(-)
MTTTTEASGDDRTKTTMTTAVGGIKSKRDRREVAAFTVETRRRARSVRRGWAVSFRRSRRVVRDPRRRWPGQSMSSSGVVDDAELRRRLSRSTIVPRRSNQWQRSDSPPQIRRPEDASFVARGASFHRQRGDEGTLQRIRETTKTRSASSRPTESRVEREVHRRDVPTSRRPRRLVRSAAQRRRSTLRDGSFLPVSIHEAEPRRRLSRQQQYKSPLSPQNEDPRDRR